MICVFFRQKTAYEMRISDWSSDVCSSDLNLLPRAQEHGRAAVAAVPFFPGVAVDGEDGVARQFAAVDQIEHDIGGHHLGHRGGGKALVGAALEQEDRKSKRLNSSH